MQSWNVYVYIYVCVCFVCVYVYMYIQIVDRRFFMFLESLLVSSDFADLYLSIYLSIHPSIHLYAYPSIHLSIYPSMHLSFYLSVQIVDRMHCMFLEGLLASPDFAISEGLLERLNLPDFQYRCQVSPYELIDITYPCVYIDFAIGEGL